MQRSQLPETCCQLHTHALWQPVILIYWHQCYTYQRKHVMSDLGGVHETHTFGNPPHISMPHTPLYICMFLEVICIWYGDGGIYMSQYAPRVTISISMKGGWACPLHHPHSKIRVSTQHTRPMHMESHQKEAWHHQSIMWWHPDDIRVFWMTFISVLKGYKRKNAWEGGGSKFQFHWVKIHTPRILRCAPAPGLPGISIKRENHVFS